MYADDSVLTYDEHKAAEAAFRGLPLDSDWSRGRSSSTSAFSRSPVAGTSSTIAAARRQQPSDPDSRHSSAQPQAPQR